MSGGLMILLIIVVWLFVLAPLLLRGQKPMSKAGEAFEDTRVVYSGDSGEVPARPQPRLRAGDVRRRRAEDDADYEIVAAEEGPEENEREDDLLIDEPRPARETVVDGDVVAGELTEGSARGILAADSAGSTAASVLMATRDDAGAEIVEFSAAGARADDAEDAYDVDDAYLAPEDLLYRGTPSLAVVGEDEADEADEDGRAAGSGRRSGRSPAGDAGESSVRESTESELTEEEIAWAKSRSGRGGWDPERDRTYSTTRYQRRQRTLLGLAIAVVLAVALGIVVGGWSWLLAALAGGLTVLYLFALRQQVREEQALRARRIRHLRRARLGVRSTAAEELHIPQQLRRPGAVVMELDDESPDFDYLPTVEDYDRPLNPQPRTTGKGSLRVS
ncbi:divisome protein SepX/GlpR [Corynebacterium guangdongense]|uniref:DUF3329 domain-containing protein n=1 Tax=Corynebacterium guangdongense TaxID=1783348 RepID=A0ABU1ZWW6_9CORY|nr:gephyrin-like molybdotransferase receptor GlpR [Corynebacterium guangdongense]MDR7328843.1 hypothetical protein [Corynebacterium guangdongense]WJZ17418.1 hypothetical protein CGUA_04135 [Corynebacterium guangdongense]